MTPNHPPEDEEQSSMTATLVRAMLERHGIPKHKLSAVVGEFFGLSRSAAHRRVHGSAPWSLEELQKLAAHYGESLAEVVGTTQNNDGTPAVMQWGGTRWPARVWLGEETTTNIKDPFVAVRVGGEYQIVSTSQAAGSPIFRVKQFSVDQTRRHLKRIAVLDDDRSVTDALCTQMGLAGYEPTAYYTEEALAAEFLTGQFDAFVIDWMLSGTTATGLIAKIRAAMPQAVIAVLTGEIKGSMSRAAGVAEASTTYRFRICEKPARLPLIVAALNPDAL